MADYLPDYTGPGRVATIHQLLNHTSGIPTYTGLGARFWERDSRVDLTHAQMLELFAASPLDFAPGTKWAYNNSGYYVLGMILERVTGAGYASLLEATQWRPLELAQTSYCHERTIIPHRAEGYEVFNEQLRNASYISMNTPFAAGALCSTPRDLVRWTRALFAGRVVTAQSLAMMTTPTRLADGTMQPYGYGLSSGQLDGHAVVQHSGGINGFSAFLAHYPTDSLTVVVIANGPTNVGMLQQRIARAVLGLPEPAGARVLDLPLTAAERARYVGHYDLKPTVPLEIRIHEVDGRLYGEATGQGAFPLRYQGDHTFLGPDATGIRMVFSITDDRATQFILHQAGRSMPARRLF